MMHPTYSSTWFMNSRLLNLWDLHKTESNYNRIKLLKLNAMESNLGETDLNFIYATGLGTITLKF